MPLKCLNGEKEIFAFNIISDVDWEMLRCENASTHTLKMPCCKSNVILRTSCLGTRHFAHSKRGECSSAQETAEHLLAKSIIINGVNRTEWIAKSEQAGMSNTGEKWIADVLAIKDEKKIAFEVQWSNQSEYETILRQKRYDDAKVRGLWLFRQLDFPVDKKIPAFHLSFNNEVKSFNVSMPRPGHNPVLMKSYIRSGLNCWQQTIELSQFIEGALQGRLKWAPFLNKHISLEVWTAYAICWRCHKKTNVITELVFVPGKNFRNCEQIYSSIYEFEYLKQDGKYILMSLLPSEKLNKYGIGVIKPRYSKTLDHAYLSNGCVHCDALQGKNFEHEYARYSKKAFETTIYFDEDWVRKLPHQEYINYWWFED